MWPIEKRCQQRHTVSFVTSETVDLLGEKMIGIVADRRMTKVHRYLGEDRGTPDVRPGLRVWKGGYGRPTTLRPGQSASVQLASRKYPFEGIGIGVRMPNEDESTARDRYHHPEKNWLGERREITLVELDGFPGSPSSEDRIRVEYWNEHGVGQETTLVFDDLDPVQELFWDATGDKERRVYMDDEFCTAHELHLTDSQHTYRSDTCSTRRATLAENLRALAAIAEAVSD
jgi:hypothetical protein